MGDELDLQSLWSLLGKKIGSLGIGERSTDAVKTSQGVMDGSTSAFAEKMNWLQNNPNMTDEEKQLIGLSQIKPSAWQEKMNWLSENPNATDQQKQIDVMQRGGDTIQNLGIGTRGLDTAAERDFLVSNYFGGQNLPNSTVGQGAMQGQLGRGTMPTGQPNMGALGMRAEFNRQMSALPPQEVQRVQQILAQLNDEQRKTFMQGVANGNTPLGGYGVQDESFRQ